MDEPTNHLDIESFVWLERFLKSRSGALLMTSQRPREFMNRVVGKIAEIDDGEITMYSGNYDFYEREREIRERTARRPTRSSRRCWPRSSGSSTASPPTRPRRRRCRAG
jgi:ATPase subunit of ABC transporter with duplicated ATPase domains